MSNLQKYEEIWGPLDEWPQGPEVLKQIVMRLRSVVPGVRRNPDDEFALLVDVNVPHDLFDDVPGHMWPIMSEQWHNAVREYYGRIGKALEPMIRQPIDAQAVSEAIHRILAWFERRPEHTIYILASYWFGVDLWMQS